MSPVNNYDFICPNSLKFKELCLYLYMKLIEFISRFPDEESCRNLFRDYRIRNGIKCPHCHSENHYYVNAAVPRFQCKECGYRQSIRANTIMHHSHMTYRQWFIAMHLMTSTKGNLSASEVQRQLGVRNYRPVWRLCNKLRRVMSFVNDTIMLEGEVEVDEAFFKLKPMSGSNHKHLTPVIVMAESYENGSSYKFGKLKMKVVKRVTGSELYINIRKSIKPGSVLRADGTDSHNLARKSYKLSSTILHSTEAVMSVLPWVHISIGHVKNLIKDVYHGVDPYYLQLYLDEFVWKKNNRYNDLFHCLLDACSKYRIGWFPR